MKKFDTDEYRMRFKELNQKPNLTEYFIALGLFAIIAFLYYSDILSYWFVSDDAFVGNILDQGLKEIWNGTPLRNIRDLHCSHHFKDIPLCSKCQSWI